MGVKRWEKEVGTVKFLITTVEMCFLEINYKKTLKIS
jgi:hypothetical protein